VGRQARSRRCVHPHLKDASGNQSSKGSNPCSGFTIGTDRKALSSIVKAYDPPYSASANVYSHISENLATWVEEAVTIRAGH